MLARSALTPAFICPADLLSPPKHCEQPDDLIGITCPARQSPSHTPALESGRGFFGGAGEGEGQGGGVQVCWCEAAGLPPSSFFSSSANHWNPPLHSPPLHEEKGEWEAGGHGWEKHTKSWLFSDLRVSRRWLACKDQAEGVLVGQCKNGAVAHVSQRHGRG